MGKTDDHTLLYFFTGVSEPLPGLPEYFIVAYMDDKQILRYSSDTGEGQSVATWLSQLGPEHWERESSIAKLFYPEFRHNLRVAMTLFNQTGGFHSGQWMFGCQLRDDGSTVGYCQIGYDGKDLVFLDKEREIYIPAVQEVQLITQEWNGPALRWGVKMKEYMEIECIEQINSLIKYGKEDLERRVRPEVKVWGRPQSNDVMDLQCLVYGFHPRAVHLKWVKNGVDDVPSDEMTPILPHPDGTYQIRITAEVPTREGDTYSCHVEHSSLKDGLTVGWKPNGDHSLGVIIGSCVGAIVAVTIILLCAVRLYRASNTGSATGPSYTPRA